MFRPLWIDVNLNALAHNFRALKKAAQGRKIMAVIKQEAYGHGLIPVARVLSFQGVDFFGLGSLEEAISLRGEKINDPVLVLTVVPDKHVSYFVQYSLRPTIVSLRFAEKLNREAKKKKQKVPVHVKIDTGMGRLGLWHEDAERLIRNVSRLDFLSLEGIFTHFPAADTDKRFTGKQIKIFSEFIKNMANKGVRFKYRHASNSAALNRQAGGLFDIVRPGIALYGIKPCCDFGLPLIPVLSLKAKVVFIKTADKGISVSYGRTYFTKKKGKIAVVSIGYADGYPWSLSNKGRVIINDQIFGISGRVCMDHVMVDAGSADVKVNDTVILIGKSKSREITVEDLAARANTIPYEIVSRLSLKIPRNYTL